VDLVESTALAHQLSTRDIGKVLLRFERIASDAVTEAGGRVLKLIGDEVPFTVPDPRVGRPDHGDPPCPNSARRKVPRAIRPGGGSPV
jgi:class 3 adenylate cyclase